MATPPTARAMADAWCHRRDGDPAYREGFEAGVTAERTRTPINVFGSALPWEPDPRVPPCVATVRHRPFEPEASPLAQAMIAISQRCYSAEWRDGLATDLWDLVHHGGYYNRPAGDDEVTVAEIANLRALAAASGCWCDWSEAEGRPVDVPLGEWLGRFWNVKGGAT
jgi:hypothetical protein